VGGRWYGPVTCLTGWTGNIPDIATRIGGGAYPYSSLASCNSLQHTEAVLFISIQVFGHIT
jgi:hypothetical protein